MVCNQNSVEEEKLLSFVYREFCPAALYCKCSRKCLICSNTLQGYMLIFTAICLSALPPSYLFNLPFCEFFRRDADRR